jgi:hypothetical protein
MALHTGLHLMLEELPWQFWQIVSILYIPATTKDLATDIIKVVGQL